MCTAHPTEQRKDLLRETKPISGPGHRPVEDASCETKPICPAGRMVCTAHPTEQREDLLRQTKPISGPSRRPVEDASCETKPICPAGRMVCTAHPTEQREDLLRKTKPISRPSPLPMEDASCETNPIHPVLPPDGVTVRNKPNSRAGALHGNLRRARTLALPCETKPIRFRKRLAASRRTTAIVRDKANSRAWFKTG